MPIPTAPQDRSEESSLLQRAMREPVRYRTNRAITTDAIELAVAWFQGRITMGQAGRVIGIQSSNYKAYASGALREGVRRGIVTVSYNGDTAKALQDDPVERTQQQNASHDSKKESA